MFSLVTSMYPLGSAASGTPDTVPTIGTTTNTVVMEEKVELPKELVTPITGSDLKAGAETGVKVIDTSDHLAVEKRVKEYFSDIPILAEIAHCESNYTQIGKDGEVMRGTNPDDVGVMQINEYYNGDSSAKLGYDIETLEGNLAFARHLYREYGTQPWKASSKCWKVAKLSDQIASR
jgi:hypothetical protein